GRGPGRACVRSVRHASRDRPRRAAKRRLGAGAREAGPETRGPLRGERVGEGRVAERARLRGPGSRMAALSVHHVGVAVDDLEQAVLTWVELFGAAVEHRESLDDQGVEAVSLRTGSGRVELLAPLGPDAPVRRLLA